ncbi:MAG TPA: nucleotidyl transferase AbiEii/AbiGii toxin family protein [Ktedonobacterales bacterium]|nr:nucleotidyl transferase AbiEii/AbiGii toxin family protein [Ktedonobacterales bacterium]
MPSPYKTARAFRAALEDRLNQLARDQQADVTRLRRLVGFERLLARLFAEENPPWLLKGGYACELRLLGKARGTRDIDLAIPMPAQIAAPNAAQLEAIRERLQEEAERDLEDWFAFRIGPAMSDLDAAPYGGGRFPVEAVLDYRTFARFHLDVGLGDAVVSPPDRLQGRDLLTFAAIPPARIAVLPSEQQFAEKIHAYSLSRGERINNRVKDLVDLVLLIELGLPDGALVVRALDATFARRRTHALPRFLLPPPEEWRDSYASLAAECGMHDVSLGAAYAALSTYWQALPFPAETNEPPEQSV